MQRSRILGLLEAHGILPTPQRVEVAVLLLVMPQQLSAVEFFVTLREHDSGV